MPVVYSSYVVKVSVLNKGAAVSDHDSVRLRPHLLEVLAAKDLHGKHQEVQSNKRAETSNS
jgi:hypothetical protein